MCEKNAPKIEFPCSYPIKVLGEKHPDLEKQVLSIMEQHSMNFDKNNLKRRESRHGRWESLTVVIEATGEQQLQAIFNQLKNNHLVRMVL